MFLLTLNRLGIKFCTSNSRLKIDKIRPLITNASQWDNCEPSGYVLGKNFVAYIETHYYTDQRTIKIFAPNNFLIKYNFFDVKDEDEILLFNKNNDLDLVSTWIREGTYTSFMYEKMTISVKIKPNDNQKVVLDSIVKHNESHSNTVILLNGEVNTGKSSVALLLALQLKYHIVDCFNPTEPGDTLSKIIQTIKPNKNKKLIVVFDEVDVMIERIHYEKQLNIKMFQHI